MTGSVFSGNSESTDREASNYEANAERAPNAHARPPNKGLAFIAAFDDDGRMQYPGGKGKCFQHLINLMPPHQVYIETHLGGGAVIRNKRAAERSIGIDLDAKVIERWRANDSVHWELVHGDAHAFLRSYDFTGRELVYCDPPYVCSTRRRSKIYRHEYDDAMHAELLEILNKLPCMVMVSGYNSQLYDAALAPWNKRSFQANTQAGVRTESVWFNFEPPQSLHDATFLGANFREREAVKRRHERLFDRFERMNPVERRHVLQTLTNKFGTVDHEPTMRDKPSSNAPLNSSTPTFGEMACATV